MTCQCQKYEEVNVRSWRLNVGRRIAKRGPMQHGRGFRTSIATGKTYKGIPKRLKLHQDYSEASTRIVIEEQCPGIETVRVAGFDGVVCGVDL